MEDEITPKNGDTLTGLETTDMCSFGGLDTKTVIFASACEVVIH